MCDASALPFPGRGKKGARRDVERRTQSLRRERLIGLLLGVELTGTVGMFGGEQMMAMRNMRMVRCLLVILLAMVMSGTAMMLGRCLVMLRRLFVMLSQFGCVHRAISGLAGGAPARRSDISAMTILRAN